MMKKIGLITLLIFLSLSKIFSGDVPDTYFVVSPGVKFAYVFGVEDSYTYGFELAISYLDSEKWVNYGGVLAIDFNKKYQKVHLGFEVLFPYLSVEFGPTFLIDKANNESHLGYSISPFLTGIVVVPVFTYSNFKKYKSLYELGILLKYPFYEEDNNGTWNHIYNE